MTLLKNAGITIRTTLLVMPLLCLTACSLLEDPATRLAYVIESEVRHLGQGEGAHYTIRYRPPVSLARDDDSYSVQFDKVGALIVWYKNASGKVIDSGSTSYHDRFVATPKTYIVDKPGNKTLLIELERMSGRAVIVGVH